MIKHTGRIVIGGLILTWATAIWVIATLLQPNVWVRETQGEDFRYRQEIIYHWSKNVTYHQVERSDHSYSNWHHLEVTSILGDNCYKVNYRAPIEEKSFSLCSNNDTLVFSNDVFRRASKIEALVIYIKSLVPIDY